MKISKSSFTLEANGFADGPVQPFRDYLIAHKAKRVVFINHPLVSEGPKRHVVTVYENGKQKQKVYKLPNKPPYTFAFDPFIPVKTEPTTAWFGYSNLSAYRGIHQRKKGKTQKVYYWAVDFVPNRFGRNPLTKLYNHIDKRVVTQADGRIELSQAAMDGRSKYLGLPADKRAPGILIPMGTWLNRTPKTSSQAWKKKHLVYMGHLVERQGVDIFLDAVSRLIKKYPDLHASIIGGGPLLSELKAKAKKLGLERHVTLHGFVKDYNDVESLLADATIAVAPYKKEKDNFSQFADPGKLKAYLGASLPIVMTDVPPNARDLANAGAAILVEDSPKSLADGIDTLLGSQADWKKARAAASREAEKFDWERLFKHGLKQLGFVD